MTGVSSAEIRNKVVPCVVEQLKPETVFDLGMGSGTYGACIHAYNSKIIMIGLDGWLPYLMRQWAQEHYTARIHTSIEAVLHGVFPLWGDLVLCMDVVEHFEKVTAVTLLKHLHKAPIPAIISTPLFEYKQGPVEGNPYEEHKCWFEKDEILELGYQELFWEEHIALDGQSGFIGAFKG